MCYYQYIKVYRKDGGTMNSSYTIRIGDVYLMKFCGTGSEQQGWRPGIVFQNNKGNTHSPNIIALPLTTSIKKMGQPTHVFIDSESSGLRYDSVVLCENPERMSKDKIGKYITTLSSYYMGKIAEASLLATSAICFIEKSRLLDLYEIAIALNSDNLTA